MARFKIHPNYIFEYDSLSTESCIYDAILGEKRIVNARNTKLITELLSKEWDEITDENTKAMAKNLILEGVGYLFLGNVFAEKYEVTNGMAIPGLLEPIPFLDRIYLNLGESDDSFITGYFADKRVLNRCNTSIAWKNSPNLNSKDCLDSFIKKFQGFYIQKISVWGVRDEIGLKKLSSLVNSFRAKNTDLIYELVTDGLVEQKVIDYCIQNNISIHFTLFGESQADYCSLFGADQSYDTIFSNIDYLKSANIKFSVSVVCDSNKIKNADFAEFEQVSISEIVGDSKLITIPDYSERRNKLKVNYFKNKNKQSCLFRKLAIDADGTIYPCPEINEPIGNVVSSELSEIFTDSALYKWWKKDKTQCKRCTKCVHRFGCEDCAAVELLCEQEPGFATFICEHMEV